MKVAGIDVSSKTVTLVISHDGRTTKPREFKNTPQGHATLSNRLRQAKVSRVCLEATGQYHLDLALDDAGLELMVVNPKAAKRFAEAMQTRTKSDPVDATILAVFAHRMPFTPWCRPDAVALAIRACARRIAALNKLRTQTKNQLHAAQQTATTPDFLLANLQHSIDHFEAQIAALRQQVLEGVEKVYLCAFALREWIMAISYSLHFQAPATVRNGDRSPARDGNCLFKHPLRR